MCTPQAERSTIHPRTVVRCHARREPATARDVTAETAMQIFTKAAEWRATSSQVPSWVCMYYASQGIRWQLLMCTHDFVCIQQMTASGKRLKMRGNPKRVANSAWRRSRNMARYRNEGGTAEGSVHRRTNTNRGHFSGDAQTPLCWPGLWDGAERRGFRM